MSARSKPPASIRILVTGDALVDHHIYEGQRMSAGENLQRGFRATRELGGACLIVKLLDEWNRLVTKRTQEQWEEAMCLACNKLNTVRMLLTSAQKTFPLANEKVKKLTEEQTSATKDFEEATQTRNVGIPTPLWSANFGLSAPPVHSPPCGHHALATWQPFLRDPADKKSPLVWRAGALMGFGHDEHSLRPVDYQAAACHSYDPKPEPGMSSKADILVLDDGGFIFRHQHHQDCWFLPNVRSDQPKWIVLKMSGPVAQGDLWTRLAEPRLADKLVCIVPAHELRRECVELAKGLSWEKSVEDLHAALTGPLKSLALCPRHLIVTLSTDGALWIDNSNRKHPKATLVFDAGGAEGQWSQAFHGHGEAFGYLSCFTTAIIGALAAHTKACAKASAGKKPPPELSFGPSIAAGLAAMRNLRQEGHGLVEKSMPDGFPVSRLAGVLLDGTGAYAYSRVPWTSSEWRAGQQRNVWRMVETSQIPFGSSSAPSLHGLARQVVMHGARAIKRLPHARFGELLTADRVEIETLRMLRRLMVDYRNDKKAKKPLSIGVFGPPGAGKSFGVKAIATDKSVFGEESWKEFNLSQFNGPADLIGAFHQIRDLVLACLTPVVFWDEFDSRGYDWLQYLLAPMQDGRFQEGPLTHPIGKCVFIFAGGTSPCFEDFGPPKSNTPAWAEFSLRKGPDFHSRLDAYYDVLGPNPRQLPLQRDASERRDDPNDACVPLRRSILLRAKLNVPENARLDIELPLLDALLRVPHYRHGARSLEKLALALQPQRSTDAIRRSALPPGPLIAMHTGEKSLSGPKSPKPVPTLHELITSASHDEFRSSEAIELLAAKIHESWRRLAAKQGWKMKPHLDKEYSLLAEADKEDNRAAARRIPDVLALAGMTIQRVKAASTPSEAVSNQIRHHLDLLAEAEHDGWVDHKHLQGWTFAPVRDDTAKRHHLLVPYDQLPEHEKNKDRDSVENYPHHLALAKYEVVFSGQTGPVSSQPRLSRSSRRQ